MKYSIKLFSELESFQLRSMGANTTSKIDKLEKDFASWKEKNGFDQKMDMEDLAVEFRSNMPTKSLEEYYNK